MSRDLGRDVPDLEKLHARKLWADFLLPISEPLSTLNGLFLSNALMGPFPS